VDAGAELQARFHNYARWSSVPAEKEDGDIGVEPGAELSEWREPKKGQKAGFRKWKTPKSPYDLFMEVQGVSTGTSACIKSKTSRCNRVGCRGSRRLFIINYNILVKGNCFEDNNRQYDYLDLSVN
jgi:hypothetical protein